MYYALYYNIIYYTSVYLNILFIYKYTVPFRILYSA